MMKSNPEQATLHDVARLTGVAPSTVSRALRGHPHVKRQTVERIREAAQRLNYQPNLSARALALSRFPKNKAPYGELRAV